MEFKMKKTLFLALFACASINAMETGKNTKTFDETTNYDQTFERGKELYCAGRHLEAIPYLEQVINALKDTEALSKQDGLLFKSDTYYMLGVAFKIIGDQEFASKNEKKANKYFRNAKKYLKATYRMTQELDKKPWAVILREGSQDERFSV